jgi:hypothetical protein
MLSVEKVIKKGLLLRTIIAVQVAWAIPFMIYVAVKELPFMYFVYGMVALIAFIFFLLAIAMQHWRIWALTNVDDPHDFKKRAEECWLIPQHNKVFGTLEIHSSNYKQTWLALQERYKETPRLPMIEIPPEGFSFNRNTWLRLFTKPLWLFRTGNNYQLNIDREKLMVNNAAVYYWKNISNEEIGMNLYDNDLEASNYTLSFMYDDEQVRIPLAYYKINGIYLDRIIKNIRLGHL